MDFTTVIYRRLLEALQERGYTFQTFEQFIAGECDRRVVLRHDVDSKPANAVAIAGIEREYDIRASYHFRVVAGAFDEEAVSTIAAMGHEVAYHYEDLGVAAAAMRREAGSQAHFMEAWRLFRANLATMRRYYPVRVISMHGSPLSRFDNRELWRYYDYRDDDIICEPYFDIDYSSTLYLTDTGRRWDGGRINLRDRVTGVTGAQHPFVPHEWASVPVVGSAMAMTEESLRFQEAYTFRSTKDIIKAVRAGSLPGSMIINTHPQRWTDSVPSWLSELVWQNAKNSVKYVLRRWR